jgi:hypothetical protein
MAALTIKKHPVTRAVHYLFLLPFLPALRPLLVNYRPADMVIYLSGIVLVVFLVIYGNHKPLLKTDRGGLSLYLHYRHNAEYHPFSGIVGYKRLSSNRIMIQSKGHRPVVLNMKKADMNTLISRMENENIHATDNNT